MEEDDHEKRIEDDIELNIGTPKVTTGGRVSVSIPFTIDAENVEASPGKRKNKNEDGCDCDSDSCKVVEKNGVDCDRRSSVFLKVDDSILLDEDEKVKDPVPAVIKKTKTGKLDSRVNSKLRKQLADLLLQQQVRQMSLYSSDSVDGFKLEDKSVSSGKLTHAEEDQLDINGIESDSGKNNSGFDNKVNSHTSGRMASFMTNVSKLLSTYQKKTLKQKDTKAQRRREKQEARQSMQSGDLIYHLKRGGVQIITSLGPIQFGIPPESVKDSMQLGLRVPAIYVVPHERFNLSAGVNVCEIEFPAFFNFFILQKKTTLITSRNCYDELRAIFKEALYGPNPEYLYARKEYSKFCPESIREACPDHEAEIFHFRAPSRNKPLDIDMLLDFKFFDQDGVCDLGKGVVITDDPENGRFVIHDETMHCEWGRKIANNNSSSSNAAGREHRSSSVNSLEDDNHSNKIYISYRAAESCSLPPKLHSNSNKTAVAAAASALSRPARKSLVKFGDVTSVGNEQKASKSNNSNSSTATSTKKANKKRPSQMYQKEDFVDYVAIPKFGLTVLGNSHGFDPRGSTSGFVLWVQTQGIMIDPPPYSTQLLLDAGIQPNSISAIILTHCHADHDSGTFQKMITEQKVTLMTTTTIFESFKRKYAAISGLKPEFIQKLVNFRPMFLEEPNYWNGAKFRFFYSLHSIPCVGFQVSFEGKDIVYSGDTFYDPPELERMQKEGILSEQRMNALLNFPWHCDLVLHEAGVPPIHTPIEALAELPDECKKNIYLIHIDKRAADRAESFGFRIAKAGVENTIILVPSGEDHKLLKFLQLVSEMEIFRHFTVSQALDLMLMSKEAFYPKGSMILKKGVKYDRFMIILQGKASVQFHEMRKVFRSGDYLGEIAAWNQARTIQNESTTDDDQLVKESVLAETNVRVMEIDRYALNMLLINDNVLREKLEGIIKVREDGSWEAISSNSILRKTSSKQKTQLQSLLVYEEVKRGDYIWVSGDPISKAVLIATGRFVFEEIHGPVLPDPADVDCVDVDDDNDEEQVMQSRKHAPLSTGMLLFDYHGIYSNRPITTTLVCASKKASIFVLKSKDMLEFLDNNPSVLLALLKSPIIM